MRNERALNKLKELLPGDIPEPEIGDEISEYRFEIYEEFLDQGEWELAFGCLVYIASAYAQNDRSSVRKFWDFALIYGVMLFEKNLGSTWEGSMRGHLEMIGKNINYAK